MADGGGQRLLDVIDDPNALESFLGGLTSESDLLPSAESVDTVVASLQSLAADYDVDSPNETLFDTLEASPNNLTDISQSYVPSDFEGGGNVVVYGLSNGGGGTSGGNEELVNNSAATTAASYPASSTAASTSSSASNINALVNSTLDFPTSVCDSNNSFVLGQHIPITSSSASTAASSTSCETSLSFSQLTHLHTEEKADVTEEQEEQQQQQQVSIPSLSSVSSSDIVSNSSSGSANNNDLNSAGLTNTSSSPLISLHNNNNVVVSTNNSSSLATIATSSPVTSSTAGIQRQLQQLASQQPQQQQQQSSQNLQFTLQQVSTAQQQQLSLQQPQVSTVQQLSLQQPQVSTVQQLSLQQPQVSTVQQLSLQQPQVSAVQQLSLQQPQVSTVQQLSLQQPQVSAVQQLSLQQPQVSAVQQLSLQQPQVTVSTGQQLTLQPQQLQQIQQSIQQQINQQQQQANQFQIQQQSPQVSQPSIVVSSVANNVVTSHVGSISTSTAPQISVQISQQQQQQPSSQASFIVNTNGHHQTINQIVQQQQQQSQQNSVVSLSNMTMGSLMSSTANNSLMSNVISSAGGNVMLSTGAQGQQYITMEQPQTLLGGATFGGGNLVLAAGGAYAVLPTAPQIFANAIVQPQQLQALKNATTGQTFFQTANGSIVAAPAGTSIAGLQGAVQNVQSIRAKTQPQILPKPSSSGGTLVATSAAAVSSSEATNTTTTIANDHGASQGQVSVNVGQLIQQQGGQIQIQNQHHHAAGATGIVTSVPNGGVTLSQPSFTINNAGQVVMAGATAAPQAQLAGATTFVLNQFGQPMLLPTGGANQNNGLQFILRQQPAQPQVLTIQAPHQGTNTTTAANSAVQGATTTNVKQVVRYVPQLTQNQTVQIQQIQTPNGPAYIAVRCPQQQQPSQATTSAQIVAAATAAASGTVQGTTTTSTEVQQQQHVVPTPTVVTPSARTPVPQQQQVSHASSSIINTLQQQTLASITQKTKQQITIKAERVQNEQQRPFSSTPPQQQNKPSAIPDSSPNTPKKKKPSKSKKKVTLDLDEILKQSGIGDEDLQDDSCFENIPTMTLQADTSNGYQYQTGSSVNSAAHQTTPTQKHNGSIGKPELPVNILSPHVHVLQPTTTLPKGGRSNNNTKNNSLSPGGAGSSSNNSNNTNIVLAKKSAPNKKSPAKRKGSDVSNGGEPPAKMIMSSPANTKPLINNSTATQKFTPGNNSFNKNNSPKAQQQNYNNNNNNFNKNNNSPISNNNNRKKPSPKKNTPVTPKGNMNNNIGKTVQQQQPQQSQFTPSTPTPVAHPAQASPSTTITTTQQQQATAPVNGSTQPQQQQRIVHTIQLTPQNQQLLRNIQVQIHRLMALPKRNETEQTALQKLIFLQQQVIATGTPVSSPAGNLSGNVNTGAVTSNAAAVSAVSSSAPITTTTIPTPNPPPAQPTSIVVTIPTTSINGTQASTTATNQMMISMGSSSVNTVGPTTPSAGVNQSGQNTPSLYLANAQNHNLVIKNEKTDDVTDSRIPDLGVHKGVSSSGPSQGYSTGSTVLVVEDPKIAEQRRAAAKAEEEARAKWRKEQFDFLLKRDQEFFVEPDYKTPFTSKEDAVERLMKYHLGRDKTEMDFEDFDEEFSDTAVRLLDKFSAMVAKYKYLMLKESIKETNCAERVMVERMFCNEEKLKLEQDKLLVAQGEILELPPPPDEWMPKLEEMVEADMREMELDSSVNLQVQSAIDSIIGFGTDDSSSYHVPDESEKIEYDAFGVPTGNSSSYSGIGSSSSADIDEAVRSILA